MAAKLSNVQTGALDAPKTDTASPRSLADQIKADATRIEYETDMVGRKIGAKKLNFFDTHKIACLLGDDAANGTAFNQAIMTASVVEIDGENVPRPTTRMQLEALMTRLDFHGISAAMKAMNRFTSIGSGDEKDEIKN